MFRDKTGIALYLSAFLLMVGIGMMVPLLPERIVLLTGQVSQVGYLTSAFALSYIVLQVPFGSLADRYGFKHFLIGGYFLCGVTGLVYTFAGNAPLIFLGRAIQGAGEAPIWALAPALLALQYPAERAKVMGRYNAVFHLGLTVGPLLGLWLTRGVDSRVAFLIYAALCFISMGVITLFVSPAPRTPSIQTRLNLKDVLALLRRRPIAVMFAGIALYGAGYGIFITGVPAYLLRERALDESTRRVYFTLFYVALSISQLVIGRWLDQTRREPFMIGGMALAAACLILVPGTSQNGVLIFLALVSLGFGTFHVASMAQLNDAVADALKGTISGMYYLFWGIGYFFGPLFFGQISALSFTPAFIGLALLLALEMFLLLGVRR